MACMYLFPSGMIKDQTEKSNRIQHFLRVTPDIVFTGYQEKREEGVDWYSPPYYTHLHGYKMCVNVCLHPSRTELYVYSYLLRGEYDADLKWPFKGTVVVELLNQLSDDNHYNYVFDYSKASSSAFQRVTSGERSSNKAPSGHRLPLTALGYNQSKNCHQQYLNNDCLKIVVRNF